MRLVFAGTPDTALPSLDALLASGHEVAAVVTRPDAPVGRGQRVAASPVAERAASAGVEVLRPARAGDPGFLGRLRAIGPDCCPVIAYGGLIPQPALDIPRHGWVNLHFSLLPAWRGAAPVQHAILHGDDITGATTFRLVRELDAGPVYGVVTEPVAPGDTAGDLLARLARSGAELLVRTLDGIEAGKLEALPQAAGGVTQAPKLTTGDARVRWDEPAPAVSRRIRACTPAPGAWTLLGDVRLKLWPLADDSPAVPGAGPDGPGPDGTGAGGTGAGGARPEWIPLRPGELLACRDGVLAGTGTHPVRLGEVQPPGKRRMTAAEWARGLHLRPGVPQPERLVLR